MLHEARRTGLAKPRCGIVSDCGDQLRAVLDEAASALATREYPTFAAQATTRFKAIIGLPGECTEGAGAVMNARTP